MGDVQQVTVELPEEVLAQFSSASEAAERMRRYAVLDLLKRKRVSQGKAAELLGIDRWALFDLMAEYDIPTTDVTPEELDQEVETLQAFRKRSG